MFRGIIIASALLVSVSAVQADAIKDRQAAMKAMSDAAKPAVGMMKGAMPFDAAKAKASLMAISDNAKKSLALYTKDSMKGKTRALPAVWEKKADFDAKMQKLAADASAAAGKATTLAALKTAMPGVLKNCGGCHKPYRAEKK